MTRPPVKKRSGLVENEPQLRLLAVGEKIDLEPLRTACAVIEDQITRLHNTLEQERRDKQKLKSDYDELSTAIHHSAQAQKAWELLGRKSNAAAAGLPGFIPPPIDQSAASTSFPFVSYSQFPTQFPWHQNCTLPATPTRNPVGNLSVTPTQTMDGSRLSLDPETPGKDLKPKKTLDYFFNKSFNPAVSPSNPPQPVNKSPEELRANASMEEHNKKDDIEGTNKDDCFYQDQDEWRSVE